MGGLVRNAMVLALRWGPASAQAQTAPTAAAPHLPFPGRSLPAGTLGIAHAGGLGFTAALPPAGVVAFSGAFRTEGLTNPGGLSFGGGGGSPGFPACAFHPASPQV